MRALRFQFVFTLVFLIKEDRLQLASSRLPSKTRQCVDGLVGRQTRFLFSYFYSTLSSFYLQEIGELPFPSLVGGIIHKVTLVHIRASQAIVSFALLSELELYPPHQAVPQLVKECFSRHLYLYRVPFHIADISSSS